MQHIYCDDWGQPEENANCYYVLNNYKTLKSFQLVVSEKDFIQAQKHNQIVEELIFDDV